MIKLVSGESTYVIDRIKGIEQGIEEEKVQSRKI